MIQYTRRDLILKHKVSVPQWYSTLHVLLSCWIYRVFKKGAFQIGELI
jgi:hypothetical protein